MKRIAVTCGYIEIDENGNKKYVGGSTDQGWCFKDMDAWKKGEGVIYISEYCLDDYEKGLMSEDDMWTREKWLNEVKNNFCDDEHQYPMEFIEWFAESILAQCDWQDLTTLMYEYEEYFDTDYEYWCGKNNAITGKKVVITIETTEYKIADTLRDLANFVEETDTEITAFEGDDYKGTIKFE